MSNIKLSFKKNIIKINLNLNIKKKYLKLNYLNFSI